VSHRDLPDVPGVIRIHHVGLVVRNAEAAAEDFRTALGLEAVALEEYQGTARVAFLRMGESLLELIEPVSDGSPWAGALRDRGEGAHHFALEVIDLSAAVRALTAAGTRMLDPRPRRAAGDVLSVFIDPAETGGTLIELVQQIRV